MWGALAAQVPCGGVTTVIPFSRLRCRLTAPLDGLESADFGGDETLAHSCFQMPCLSTDSASLW
jgi:hypothetical protein